MKLSARNVLKGRVKRVEQGPVSSLIVLEIAPGVEITSTITAESSTDLHLKEGQTAYAMVGGGDVALPLFVCGKRHAATGERLASTLAPPI
jgi:molybdopterin-binding protein